ncbi:phage terminase large subunit family protein, partial [Klebsiella pneumoniae]|uniref:phage terminase large subunit family protein n=1 Tax=Klebsiella pneumoniae TaxID=573 RepID=UPI00406AB0D8
GGTADRNRSHWSTSKTPSYTKSVSWQHHQNVKAFFPAVREFVYNPNVKNALVLKAYDIISHRRLEFDAGHTDIAQSFMAIRRATTASGNRPTYEASRSEETSHADLAWATMHALFNEPLQGESANTSNIVEIF